MKPAQFPQSPNENLSSDERLVLGRVRTRRLQATLAGLGAAGVMLFAVGCPEPADNGSPNDTPSGGTGTGTGGGGGGSSPSCETDCVKQVFGVKATGCKICHDNGANMTLKSAGLDLVTPGFTARLADQPAVHTDITTMGFNMATDCPSGDKLINTAFPGDSWMLKKIRKLQGKCGDKMPSTMDLPPADQTCVETYISCVAGMKPLTMTAGGSGAGGASGGSGGASGAATGGGGAGGASGGTGGASGGAGGKAGAGGTGGV